MLNQKRKQAIKALKSSGVVPPESFWDYIRKLQFGKAAAALIEQYPKDPEAELYADLIWAG